MKVKNLLFSTLFFCCALGIQTLNAQLVEEASITANEANFKMISPNSYLMEIAGPDDYYFRQEIEFTNNISLSNIDTKGKKFPDGAYKMQVTPIVTLSETIRQELAVLRKENDQKKIAAFRMEHELPEAVNVYNISFSIQNGQFVSPNRIEGKAVNIPKTSMIWEQDHPVLYASINNIDMEYGIPAIASNALPLATDNTPMLEDDQQFLDDVIVVGSICVGQDCNNGESFGFDTQRLKENNLRIHFDDTSTSASFPSNDWRISINDSANGGSSYFAVEDATAGNTPFRIEAGAGSNALHVDASGGNVGLGTATPVVELHVADGDSPTYRLEQNGSSGFTPQTWDIAGNETNFFIRDVTNGSKLPFRIRPTAPDNSIYIDTDGDVGMGTNSPDASLDVEGTGTMEVRLTSTDDGIAQMALNSNKLWEVRSLSDGDFVVKRDGIGGAVPLRIGSLADNNLIQIGETATNVVNVNGNITATGTITPDYVFEPEYELESIEEHAAYMWREKHLPAVDAAKTDGKGNGKVDLVNRSQQLLEELEKAHIYIEQLNKRINNEKESNFEVKNELQQTIALQAEEIANLKAQQTKMENQLAELIQMVSTLNKTHNSSDKANGEKE